MTWFNTNALHNLLNTLIAIICGGALAGFDWTLLGVSDRTALQISGVIALAKIIINAVRDGPRGMVAPPAKET
ncbi:hypothetical protein EN750_38890 [Mesorhizobium sp. M7A.F.Ca.ET.027.03.2.1]|nr:MULTISPECIES: hypothetical protein [unclassified Mesorhizobium]RVD45791.1 hypothetical protein EN750_38890 [Mesorhizobium sp. M7A.F.Ca.ET.027.03.2.1]RUU88970.1 hypothetical protein EOB59_20535 [Mesorhizobium sp. M7A.F.Ca.MR.176.00.0.0]TIM95146.1 MAG: hypothetical protein E5Y34_27135 [Mesorhizobium sp.]TIN69011.1 MAG: hypothetical protein E5Y30_21085 [Mesorhizobium sp.]TIU30936.1 MAG: hypothetical protein E5W26_33860 [Mesorhizobium sp.]